jgi:hypothetical protein
VSVFVVGFINKPPFDCRERDSCVGYARQHVSLGNCSFIKARALSSDLPGTIPATAVRRDEISRMVHSAVNAPFS